MINEKNVPIVSKNITTPTVSSLSIKLSKQVSTFVGQPFHKWDFPPPAVETAGNSNFSTIASPPKYSWILVDRLWRYRYLHRSDLFILT